MSARQSIRGNTLGEYALAGAIILGVGLLGFLALGGSISNLFGQTNQAAQVDIVPGLLGSAGGGNGGGQAGGGGQNPSQPPGKPDNSNAQGMATLTLTLSDGSKIALDYPINPAKSVDTIGANGTTELLAQTLMKLAQKLRDEGKITQDQFYLFQSVSNSGHNIATLQNGVEADLNNFDPNFLLARLKETNINDPNGWRMREFMQNYQALQDSGALNDPVVAQITANLVANTQAISNGYYSSMESAVNVFNTDWDSYKVSDVGQGVSKYVHDNAAGICNIGGGQDTGIHCP